MGRDGSSGPSLPFTVVAGWGRPAGVSFVGDCQTKRQLFVLCSAATWRLYAPTKFDLRHRINQSIHFIADKLHPYKL